jgi:hypothetical protein
VTTAAQAAWFIGHCISYAAPDAASFDLCPLLQDGKIDWLTVIRLSNSSYLTPALNLRLKSRGLAHLLPADLRAYMDALTARNGRRNQLIVDQASEFLLAACTRGIRPVLLKGGLTLLEGGLDPATPMMADVDVLLVEKEFAVACEILRSLGYVGLGEPALHAHALTFWRPGELATIDVHRHMGPQIRLLSAVAATRLAMPLSHRTLNVYGIRPTHRVILLFMNYCIFEPQYHNRELPLRNLHDLAVVCSRHQPDIDWDDVRATALRFSLEKPLRSWCEMARQLLLVQVPEVPRAGPGSRRHLLLPELGLNYPRTAEILRWGSRLAWVFNPWRMDYRYGCGIAGRSLATARLHHAKTVIAKRLCHATRTLRWRGPPP